jgi:NAD(P)-dependent dehydrogenase (short-subunit alcohol dehydrogenase family)
MTQLAGRRVVVTGSSNGCGASAVRALVREGAVVAALDVRDETGEEVVSGANKDGPGRAIYIHCDVSERSEVKDSLRFAADQIQGIDTLVHAAAIENFALPEEITDTQWDSVIKVNLRGSFITNQEVFPYLRANDGGRILNFGSGTGLKPFVRSAHYAVSKAGIIEWTRTIAHAWGRYGITANTINPAMDRTLMADEAKAKRAALGPWAEAEFEARGKMDFPLGSRRYPPVDVELPDHLGDPDTDLAPVLVFLVSDGARFITGQIIAVDGGSTPLR